MAVIRGSLGVYPGKCDTLCGELGSYLRHVESKDRKMEIQWKWVVVAIAIRTTEVCMFSCFKQC